MPTQRVKPIHLFVPFERVSRREEDDVLIVEGYCFVNEVVKGENGLRLKRSAMEAATDDYMRFGAVREMHQMVAAGTAQRVEWDEKGCRLTAEIVDEAAKKKVERNVYKGFSLGVNPTVLRGNVVETCEWVENSLVDRPKDPDALFLYRLAGYDPDAEVEVEVLDAAVAASSDAMGETAAESSSPPPESVSFAEADAGLPPDADVTAEETSFSESATDEGGGDAVRAALLAAGLPEDLLSRVEIVQTGEERALTSTSTPTRENLEGARKPKPKPASAPPKPKQVSDGTAERAMDEEYYAATPPAPSTPRTFKEAMAQERARAIMGDVNNAYVSLMDSLWSIMDSDRADKETLCRESIGQFADHMAAMAKAAEERGESPAFAGAFAALVARMNGGEGLARADKPEGDYGSHADAGYADPGYQEDGKPRYPLKENGRLSEKRIRAAWSYINKGDNRVPYSEAELSKIEAKIRAAAKEVGVEITAEDNRAATAVLEQVSSPVDGEELTAAMGRAERAETQLVRARAANEETLKCLADAEARVKRLENAPAAKPVIRFPHALDRTFLANLGREEDRETDDLVAQYKQATKDAESATEQAKQYAAIDRMMALRAVLNQRGVRLD